MKIKEFKIRASGCGSIMTNAKKKGELSKTAQSFCQTWLKEQLYNRRNEFSSKYTQKGNEVEDNSLDYIAEQLDLGMLLKNEEYFESNFLTGTPDAILKDYLIDVKNSWDCFTFPLFETEIPNKDYFYQAQCYMHLTNRKSYKLIYVLSDTPNHLIEKDAYWWCKNNGYDELDGDIFEQFVDKYTYKNINDKLKIKVFNIEYDESVIEAIYDRVAMCREYIEQLLLIIK